jgi:hypothetical protein
MGNEATHLTVFLYPVSSRFDLRLEYILMPQRPLQ